MKGLYVALGLLFDGKPPDLYLIPSRVWDTPNTVFVSRDYGDALKSKPEWGVNISHRNMAALAPYGFESVVKRLCGCKVVESTGQSQSLL